MTNHCVNILRLEQKEKLEIKKVLKDFLNSSEELTFNKVIKMPPELSRSMKSLEKSYENPKFNEKYLKSLEKKIREKNLADWGYETPEDWARENWGPEFNCYDFHWDENKNSAVFDTVSDPPLHIVTQIALKTKKSFCLSYAEPGDGKYGQLIVDPDGNCEAKTYVEETIPEAFHNEFPSTYPPSPKEKSTNKTKRRSNRDETLEINP